MKSTSSDRKRLVLVAVFLFGLNVLLILQFYKIQIIQQEKWTQGALAQHQKIVVETFRRGTIYSNTTVKEGHLQEEQPFVLDVLKFHLYIDPHSIPASEKKAVCKKICQFLHKTNEKPIYQEFLKKSRSRKIATWLDKDQKNQILSWWKSYAKQKKIVSNAVYFVKEYQRSYPFGAMLGQVLQTVQDIKDPKTMQAYPIGGLELSLNNFLKGKIGKKVLQRSARNPMDSGVVINQPEDGADVYLTINHYLQAIVEEELKKGVEVSEAKGGWAIIMDPFNGNILALAQYPFFDPRKYREYFNSEKLKEHAKVKAVSDAFEPASIFKVITTAICMQANDELMQKNKDPLFTPEEKVPTSNGHFPGRKKPLRDGRLHKFLNLNMALQKSSNVYFGQLIKRVIETFGESWYREKLLQFGFGQKTNIELPAETLGLVPTPGKKHQNGTLEWSKSTPYSLAMGHNILINSIQMVKAFSVIANGGFLVEPTLIRKIQKNNEVILDNTIEKKY
ncbi:MAG: penicillin-binding protein 2, partial [Chlamydiota bacterium]